jgi:hypothetical protein
MRDLDAKCRFIQLILDGKLTVNNRKKTDIESDLTTFKFEPDTHDMLLRMPIHSLTKERFDEMQESAKKKAEELKRIEATAPKDMYVSDLKELLKKLK